MDEVRPILKSRGYGFHSDRKYPLTLNKPSSDPKMRSKTTGTPRMEQLKPISRAELDAILTKAQNAEEAAVLIERLSLGEVLSAIEETDSGPKSGITGQLTAEQLAHIIDSRVSTKVQQQMDQFVQSMTDQRNEIANMVDSMRDLLEKAVGASPAKKRGRPPKHQKRTEAETDALLAQMDFGPPPPQA